jgi:formylglycine-generating enzyme required for sulfatase activity
MVDVRGKVCIDRYEAILVDKLSGRELSPYYPPSRSELRRSYEHWRSNAPRSATAAGRQLPIPEPPAWQLEQAFEPSAVVRPGVVPNGYVSGLVAERACQSAGKRLCRPDEWLEACRGQRGWKFPYGERYEAGRCNVFREAHPASVLHADASRHHLDPRLNVVKVDGRPLLQVTGTSRGCRSEWGVDAVHDMVGNLDEWVDDAQGSFSGGFYARNTREGCEARISSHPREYFDYSLGVRCCL